MSAYLLDLWEEPLATCAVYLLIRDVDYSLILHTTGALILAYMGASVVLIAILKGIRVPV